MSKSRPHGNDDPRGGKRESAGLRSKWATAKGGSGDGQANWGFCDGSTLTDLVDVVARTGGAVLLGYSSDGGAYKVVVMDGPDKFTEWIPCTTDVTAAIAAVADALR